MSPSPAAQPRVLIVDDAAHPRPARRTAGGRRLHRQRGSPWTGRAGLSTTHPAPCCIILDLYMPIMDGWQFHRAQLRTPQLTGIPVIVMSAVAHALQPLAWFQAAGYLPKPFGVDAVLALVASLCDPPRSRA